MEHHWKGKKPNPDKYYGFVYEITNNINGRKYIGMKQYSFSRKKKVKGSVRRRSFILPSKWEFYTGSCNELNDDIEKFGKENFTFKIIWNCTTRGMMKYMEAKEQFKKDVLIGVIDGTTVPKYYNRQILGNIRFIPKGVCR